MLKLEELMGEISSKQALNDDKMKRITSERELYRAKIERDFEDFRSRISDL